MMASYKNLLSVVKSKWLLKRKNLTNNIMMTWEKMLRPFGNVEGPNTCMVATIDIKTPTNK